MPDEIILDGDVHITGKLTAPNDEQTGDGGLGPGAPSGGDQPPLSEPLPETRADSSAEQRASDAGLTINNTVTVSSLGEIDGADNTLYKVDGELSHNGKHSLGTVNDVAIAGVQGSDARLVIPEEFRDYSLTASGGNGFMWSGIDLDQRAAGSWGRLNINVDGRGFFEYFQNFGRIRRKNPDPDSPRPVDKAGPTLHIPALNGSGTNRLEDVVLIQGGYCANQHFGDSPLGIFFAEEHAGALDIVNCQIEELPNNAIYATNCPGAIRVEDSRLYNNGVSQYRAANGYIRNSTVGYDYENTGLANADNTTHGVVGVMAEQKDSGLGGAVSEVDNCTVEMLNVGKCGGGITGTAANDEGRIENVTNNTITMGNVGGASAIAERDGSFGTVEGNTIN